MTSTVAPVYDQQGNLLVQKMNTLSFKTMKKSPSTVFAWPSFATTTKTEEIMAPMANIVQVRSTDTIRSVLWTLIKNKVDCVPVYNEANRRYVGFVDMYDLVQYISNACGSAVIRSDFFLVFKRQPLADAPISKITSSATKDHLSYATESSPVSDVLDLTVSANLPRVPVMNKHKVVNMITQMQLVQYLITNRADFQQLASKKIADLYLSGTDNVYTIEENMPTVNAFVYMAEKGVQGLAVVNSEGQFVDAINTFDTKGLVHGDFFSDLRQPVVRYLSKARILMNKHMAPLVCTKEETLVELLHKMALEQVYRVFIVDEEKKPVSVISLRDILKCLHSYIPEPETPASFAVGGGGQ